MEENLNAQTNLTLSTGVENNGAFVPTVAKAAAPTGKAAILANRQRPAKLDINAESIPVELKREERWLGWKWVWKADSWSKVPVDARSGMAKGWNKPDAWCSFEQAISAARGDRVDGIGFMLGDGFAGIDPDDCRDPNTGELSDLARDIVATMQTYAEVSPTGTGIKLFCKGTLPAGHERQNSDTGVELYTTGRFFTVTGQHIEGTRRTVADRQEALAAVHARYIASEKPKSTTVTPRSDGIPSFDIDGFIVRNELRVAGPEPWHDGGRRWKFVESPLCEHHGDGPYLVQFANGALAAGCHHASCSWDWHALRAKFAPRRYHTDVGNAERFADQHGDYVGYCLVWGTWLVWDGRRWLADTGGEIMRRAKQTALAILQEANKATDEEQRKAIVKWAFKSQGRERLSAMINLGQSELPIAVETLDSQPWLFNVENGTIDLRTGVLRPHRRMII